LQMVLDAQPRQKAYAARSSRLQPRSRKGKLAAACSSDTGCGKFTGCRAPCGARCAQLRQPLAYPDRSAARATRGRAGGTEKGITGAF